MKPMSQGGGGAANFYFLETAPGLQAIKLINVVTGYHGYKLYSLVTDR